MPTSTRQFVVLAVFWELTVGLIYGLFFRASTPAVFNSMASTGFFYNWSIGPQTSQLVAANTTQAPYPYIVVLLFIALLIVGLALIAGYIERSSVTGIAFTLLIFALTVQNFFIYRIFWENVSVNNPNVMASFNKHFYNIINPINFGDTIQSSQAYASAGLMDAFGAALAMYAAYTSVIGRVGLSEIFMLTWIGPFFYELNSQLLWRFIWTDTGYPLRAFAFGSTLGIVSSLILGKKNLTDRNLNYYSSYKVMGMAMLGLVIVWCTYPIILLSATYTTTSGIIVSLAGQVNMWQALSASALGVFAATSLYYRKFSVHEVVFNTLSGGIAYSAVTDINYNTGAATAIGFTVSFVCTMTQMAFKRKLNKGGVIDSNGAIFQFLLPSFFAAIFTAITQGLAQSAKSFNTTDSLGSTTGTINYLNVTKSGRTSEEQGGYQMLAWLLSVGIGAVAGLIIGFLYKCLNDFTHPSQCFNDAVIYNYPGAKGRERKYEEGKPTDGQAGQPAQDNNANSSRVPAILEFDYYER